MPYGDIGSVHDTLEFDGASGEVPGVCHIAGDVYAVAYRQDPASCVLATFSINAAGDISNAVLDSWVFDDQNALDPFIILSSPNRVAIAYNCNTANRLIVTIAVADNGAITKSIIDHVTFSPAGGTYASILLTHTGMLAAFRNTADHNCPVSSVTVTSGGILGDSFLDALVIDAISNSRHRMFHVYGNVFGGTIRDNSGYGQVQTFSIAPTGAISNTPISTLLFDGAVCYYPCAVKATGNYFAILYRGPGNSGFLKIAEINQAGTITDPVVDTYEFDVLVCYPGWIIAFGLGHIAIVYRDTNGYGVIKTFLVDATGKLNSTTLDTLNFELSACYRPFIFHCAGNMYGVAYEGPAGDGFLKSIDISTPPVGRPHHEMIMKIGP